MLRHDGQVRLAQRLRSAHVVEVPRPQELRADHRHQGHPVEEQQQHEQHDGVRLDQARQDDDEEKRGQPGPDLDQALTEEIDETAEIPLRGADGDADDGTEQRQRQAEQHGQPEAVDDACRDVPAHVVRAEPVAPRGRLRHRAFRVEIDGVVAEGDDRPHHPAVAGRYEFLHRRLAVLRLRFEDAAELGLRVGDEDREVERAFVTQEQGCVVRDQLREHAGNHHRADHPEAAVAALVGLEVAPAAAQEWRARRRRGSLRYHEAVGGRQPARLRMLPGDGHQPSRASKSMRGSTNVYAMSPISVMARPRNVKQNRVPNMIG